MPPRIVTCKCGQTFTARLEKTVLCRACNQKAAFARYKAKQPKQPRKPYTMTRTRKMAIMEHRIHIALEAGQLQPEYALLGMILLPDLMERI